MRKLGTLAAASATLIALIALLALAPPASAAAPLGAVDRVTGGCSGGRGVATMTMTPVDADSTEVRFEATGVPNGRWRGAYAGLDGDEHRLHATAVEHALSTAVVLDAEAAANGVFVVLSHSGQRCVLGGGKEDGLTFARSSDVIMVVRSPEPGTLITRGAVLRCAAGSVWRATLRVRYADAVVGSGQGGFRCDDRLVRVPRSTMTIDPEDGSPRAVRLALRSSDGDVRRVAFRLTPPAA
jgi:hypothetical protein